MINSKWDMKKEMGFKIIGDKKDLIWDEYIGEYIVITSQSGSNTSGRLVEVKEGYAVLNPFQGAEYDSERGRTRKLVHKNAKVNALMVSEITPTTKKDLEAFCIYTDKKEREANGEKNQKTK